MGTRLVMATPESLARKWCLIHGSVTNDVTGLYCTCDDIAAAVREGLEEAETRIKGVFFLQQHPTVLAVVIAALKGEERDAS